MHQLTQRNDQGQMLTEKADDSMGHIEIIHTNCGVLVNRQFTWQDGEINIE